MGYYINFKCNRPGSASPTVWAICVARNNADSLSAHHSIQDAQVFPQRRGAFQVQHAAGQGVAQFGLVEQEERFAGFDERRAQQPVMV